MERRQPESRQNARFPGGSSFFFLLSYINVDSMPWTICVRCTYCALSTRAHLLLTFIDFAQDALAKIWNEGTGAGKRAALKIWISLKQKREHGNGHGKKIPTKLGCPLYLLVIGSKCMRNWRSLRGYKRLQLAPQAHRPAHITQAAQVVQQSLSPRASVSSMLNLIFDSNLA